MLASKILPFIAHCVLNHISQDTRLERRVQIPEILSPNIMMKNFHKKPKFGIEKLQYHNFNLRFSFELSGFWKYQKKNYGFIQE